MADIIHYTGLSNPEMVGPNKGAFPLVPGTVSGAILFTTDRDTINQIYSMNSDGSNQVNQSRDLTENYSNPVAFNNGTKVAFVNDTTGINQVYVADFDLTNGISNIVQVSSETVNASYARYNISVARSGNIIFWSGPGTSTIDNTREFLRCRALDVNGEPTGSISTLSTGLASNIRKDCTELNAAEDKLFFCGIGSGSDPWVPYALDFDNSTLTTSNLTALTLADSGTHYGLRLNQDETKVVVVRGSLPNYDLYQYDISGTTLSNGVQLTNLSSYELGNRFSDDFASVVYFNLDGDTEIWLRDNTASLDNGTQLTDNAVTDSLPWMGTLAVG